MVLIAIAYKDYKNQKIKNEMLLLLLMLSIFHVITGGAEHVLSFVLGMLVISIPMLFISILRPGAFGGGDIKLMAAGGLYLGKGKIILAAILAVIMAALYCVWLLIYKKASRKTCFALGPFLCIGMVCSLFIL